MPSLSQIENGACRDVDIIGQSFGKDFEFVTRTLEILSVILPKFERNTCALQLASFRAVRFVLLE